MCLRGQCNINFEQKLGFLQIIYFYGHFFSIEDNIDATNRLREVLDISLLRLCFKPYTEKIESNFY